MVCVLKIFLGRGKESLIQSSIVLLRKFATFQTIFFMQFSNFNTKITHENDWMISNVLDRIKYSK
jgi:hypothetical protein